MSSKAPLLNVVHVWLPMKREGLDHKTYTEYQYMHKGLIQTASTLKPVHRYAKKYMKDNVIFTLCLITLDGDETAVEQFLDEAVKDIDTVQYAGRIFAKTDVEYKG